MASISNFSTRPNIALAAEQVLTPKVFLDLAEPDGQASIGFDSVIEKFLSVIWKIFSIVEKFFSVIEQFFSGPTQAHSYQDVAGGTDFDVRLRHEQERVCRKKEPLAEGRERPDDCEDPLHRSNRMSRERAERTRPGKVSRCKAGVTVDDRRVRIDAGPRLRLAGDEPVCNPDKFLSSEGKPFCGAVRMFRGAGGGLRHGHDILCGADVIHRRNEHRRRCAGDFLFQQTQLFAKEQKPVNDSNGKIEGSDPCFIKSLGLTPNSKNGRKGV
jgi:hypothetical protein